MSNLKSVQDVYESFGKGDIPAVLRFLSPEVAWTEAEGFPYGGTYHGPQSVLESVFMRLGADWENFVVVPEELIDGGDSVVALGTYSGIYKATGKSFKANFAHIWKIKDGKAIRFIQYVDTHLVQNALKE